MRIDNEGSNWKCPARKKRTSPSGGLRKGAHRRRGCDSRNRVLPGGLPRVRFQHAAEGLGALDLVGLPTGGRLQDVAVERQVVQRLMGTLLMVMGQVRLDEMPKVVFAEYNEVIETLDLERLQPAFHEGVHVRRPHTGPHHVDVLGLEDRVELRRELAVVVANQVGRLVLLVIKLHRQVACLLSDPRRGRVLRHAGHDHAARADVDEEQHEVVDLAAGGPDLLLEEIAATSVAITEAEKNAVRNDPLLERRDLLRRVSLSRSFVTL